MKENELRIGNLVTDEFYEHFKLVITVDSINNEGIDLQIENDGNFPECALSWISASMEFAKLRGIPLTEEWLLKFGFTHLHSQWYQKQHICAHPEHGVCLEMYESSISLGIELKYVHQLQNLYLALTGEELQLK